MLLVSYHKHCHVVLVLAEWIVGDVEMMKEGAKVGSNN